MRPRILCISFSDIRSDARVLRQVEVLSEFGDVTTLAFGDKAPAASAHLQIDYGLPSLPQTPIGVLLLAVRAFPLVALSAPAVRQALKLAEGMTFDLVVANEARALPLAHKIAGPRTPVWGDMHEWAPEERIHVLSWRLLVKPFMTWVCATYLPTAAAVTVVNDSIGELYQEQFGISTVTVRNSRAFEQLAPSVMAPGVIRLVHSGAAVPGRNLEGMIQTMRLLGSDYSLDLYLVPAQDGGRYKRQLEGLARDSDNVRILPPVLPEELPVVLNRYDLGIFSLPPRTRNHALMLPNKFFDFVQARLGIVFSASPETTRLIEKYDLGSVTRDYSTEALADAIRGMSREEVKRFKDNAHRAAEALSSRVDEDAERAILERLLHGAG